MFLKLVKTLFTQEIFRYSLLPMDTYFVFASTYVGELKSIFRDGEVVKGLIESVLRACDKL